MTRIKLQHIYAWLTIITIILMFPKYSYNDPDTFWHIELGKYMVGHNTVLHHAIHTFYGNKLPYVPHEFGFQIMVSLLFIAFGWPGTYILTAVCMILLMLGLYRLTEISREEMGLKEYHSALILFVLSVSCCIYYYYFTTRPQMISSCLIVWFFVYLRQFRLRPAIKYAVLLILISFVLANIHAGVWLVIAVFTGMAFIEAIIERSISKRLIVTFFLVYAFGFLNVGGLHSILYIFNVTKNDFNMSINEWQPIHFAGWINLPRTLLLLLFVTMLPFSLGRQVFRYMFMLGIVYLGISSYKQNLFMWLFSPYFAATAIEAIPFRQKFNAPFQKSLFKICLFIGFSVNIVSAFAFPAKIDKEQYPVGEMTYILDQTPHRNRPKVLAPYGVSGYVMFRGGNILCDGRQDPFITDATKGVLSWTAFERSMNGFSIHLPDIVDFDRPDYVIVNNNNNASDRLFEYWVEYFGEPVYSGKYGSVFRIHK